MVIIVVYVFDRGDDIDLDSDSTWQMKEVLYSTLIALYVFQPLQLIKDTWNTPGVKRQ
jgi:hypothetical protein